MANDLFLSSGKDQKFKLWDLNKADDAPLAVVDLSNKKSLVIGNFDPAGVLFAIAYVDSHVGENPVNKIRLYDVEKYSEVLIFFGILRILNETIGKFQFMECGMSRS